MSIPIFVSSSPLRIPVEAESCENQVKVTRNRISQAIIINFIKQISIIRFRVTLTWFSQDSASTGIRSGDEDTKMGMDMYHSWSYSISRIP